MAFSFAADATILQILTILLWACIDGTTTKHPNFAKVFPDEFAVETMLSLASLTFAPNLLKTLLDPTAPGITFFKALPSHKERIWGIYLLVLEKAGDTTKLYIGSATDGRLGVSKRFSQYEYGLLLSVYVKAAIDDGYTLTHKGLLCTCAIPSPAFAPTVRVLFLALEGLFAFVFWTMINGARDYGIGNSIRMWDIDQLEHMGLCSHTSIQEIGSVNLSLTAKELESYYTHITVKRKEAAKIATRKGYEKSRATDLELHREKNKASVVKYRENNLERCKARVRNYSQRMKDEKKHYCPLCDQAFPHAQALKRHNESPVKKAIHAAKLAAGARQESEKA